MTSRAVERLIQPGANATCSHCGNWVKFLPRRHRRQIIANVYVGDRWDRVEFFHQDCYDLADQPYGAPDRSRVRPAAGFSSSRTGV